MKFSKLVGTACDAAYISECITQIKQLAVLTPTDHDALNAINNDLTQILVSADRKCRKFNNLPWSPLLSKAYYEHCFWTLKLSKFRSKRSY